METSEIATNELLNKENQDEESSIPFDTSKVNSSFDLERRGSTDSNYSLRPSYKQK
jgi:hypothetical protein